MYKRRIVIITSLLAFILLTGGMTYAYIRKVETQSDQNVVSTLSCLGISLTSQNNGVSLTNTFPISDEEGLQGVPYSFTITNNCTTPVSVDINLETLSTSTLSKAYIKASITDGLNVSTKLLSNGVEKENTIANATSNNLTSVYLTSTGSEGSTKNYELRLWLDEATTLEQVRNGNTTPTYQGKIVVVATPSVNNPYEMANVIKNTYKDITVTDPTKLKTIPGQQTATGNEGLRSTEDDYGTSYYFRGAIDNNYVSFANMCWRIVRITGDGSIKLVLYNYESGDCTTVGASNAFARYDGTNYKSAFNTSRNKNAYVGFMYGTPGSSTYEAEHANNTDSTILTNLKTWYDAKLNINISQDSTKKYTDYLADTIWCNDKRLGSTEASGYTNLGYNTEKTYYKAYDRLIPKASASPTLKCGDTIEDNKISKYTASDTVNGNGKLRGVNGSGDTEYKIGLLTSDEVAFAGGVYATTNRYYYLNKNATDTWWWTMSPYYFDGSYAREWYVYSTGSLSNSNVDNARGGVRPVVSLKSTVTISSGNGEAGTPFVISY